LPYQCYSDRLRYLRSGLEAKCELQGCVLLAAWKHCELRLSTTGMLSKSIVYNHHGSHAVQSSNQLSDSFRTLTVLSSIYNPYSKMGRFNFGKSDVSSTDDSNTERRPSAVEALDNATRRKSVDDHAVTGACEITTRQSIIPVGRELPTALPCLTLPGVSCHRPLLHVGFRVRTP
jgi:hypothetical protein